MGPFIRIIVPEARDNFRFIGAGGGRRDEKLMSLFSELLAFSLPRGVLGGRPFEGVLPLV